MTQRRRMSRAAVERTPLRTVMPGVSARARWGDAFVIDDPQPQRPPAQGDVMSLETLDRLVELLKDAPQPSVVITTPWRPDRTDPAASVVRLREALAERTERRAVERTGRVLVAWLIGRWRR